MGERHGVPDVEWPPLLEYGSIAVAFAVGVVAALQRGAFTDPRLSSLLILVAVSPWILASLHRGLPWPVSLALIISASARLLWHAQVQDALPFLLVLFIGSLSATDGYRAAGVAAVTASAMMALLELAGHYSGSAIWIAGFIIAWGIGAAYYEQMVLLSRLRAAQADLAVKAAAEERQRIAREVHDVIGHTLAVMMLHLTGARMSLQRDDRSEAEAALLEAERHGRQSLADVRRSVGLLSEGAASASPEPTAADIGPLVASYRDAGVDVAFASTGDVDALPLTVGLGLYRIAQESLANATRHAPGSSVTVRLDVDADAARLAVRNTHGATVADASGGHGIEGIKERASLLGGSASAGPTDDGGWLVEVAIPLR